MDKSLKNPVILIQAEDMDRRNFYMHHLIGRKHMWFDACGSRAVIAYDKNNSVGRLQKVIDKHKSQCIEFQAASGNYGKDVKVSMIEDPGLGIVLPEDLYPKKNEELSMKTLNDLELRDQLAELLAATIREGVALAGPEAEDYPSYVYFCTLGHLIIKYDGIERLEKYIDEIMEHNEND
jgi:hypothetical protein